MNKVSFKSIEFLWENLSFLNCGRMPTAWDEKQVPVAAVYIFSGSGMALPMPKTIILPDELF